MPADIFPNEVIDKLVDRIDSPELYKMLLRIQREGVIVNSQQLGAEAVEQLRQLSSLGLVDPGFAGPLDGPAHNWLSNHNGRRVLEHMAVATTEVED